MRGERGEPCGVAGGRSIPHMEYTFHMRPPEKSQPIANNMQHTVNVFGYRMPESRTHKFEFIYLFINHFRCCVCPQLQASTTPQPTSRYGPIIEFIAIINVDGTSLASFPPTSPLIYFGSTRQPLCRERAALVFCVTRKDLTGKGFIIRSIENEINIQFRSQSTAGEGCGVRTAKLNQ